MLQSAVAEAGVPIDFVAVAEDMDFQCMNLALVGTEVGDTGFQGTVLGPVVGIVVGGIAVEGIAVKGTVVGGIEHQYNALDSEELGMEDTVRLSTVLGCRLVEAAGPDRPGPGSLAVDAADVRLADWSTPSPLPCPWQTACPECPTFYGIAAMLPMSSSINPRVQNSAYRRAAMTCAGMALGPPLRALGALRYSCSSASTWKLQVRTRPSKEWYNLM